MYKSSCVIEVVWKDHNSCYPLYKYNKQFLKIYSKQNDVHREDQTLDLRSAGKFRNVWW